MAGDYTVGNIYEPRYSSFKPGEESPYLGKASLIPTKQMGMTTDPRSANQLAALSQALNQGVIPVEISQISPQVFETIPKQHFEEMRRKAKLAEAQLSLHAPIQGMDPAGMGERGWEESQQKAVERQLNDVMDKAAMMDERGNMPVTIHGSNAAGSTFKMKDGKKVYDQLVGADKATGQLVPIKDSIQYHPEGLEKGTMTPEETLDTSNRTQWRKDTDAVLFEKETADNLLAVNYPGGRELYFEVLEDQRKGGNLFNNLSSGQKEVVSNLQTANAHIHQAELSVNTLFDKAYQYGGKDENERKGIQEELKKVAKKYERNLYGGYTLEELEKAPHEKQQRARIARMDLQNQSHAIQTLAQDLKKHNPNMIQTIEEFSINKASDTFANVAMHSYKNKGEKAPAISIENLYQGMGFSQGKDLKNLVERSQEKFANQLMKKKGISESKAQKVADKLIGVTFDVGHLNISRKHGFETEDLIKEAKEVAKFVNKVHVTDNFGFSDSHLPIGMGNVPVKKLLGVLGDKGARAAKINEVGGWFEHFKTSPFPQLLEAAGSPIYSAASGPYWSQAGGFQQSYMEGYGQMLPPTHYQLFGAGFSQLPSELGGQVGQSGAGRMGGGGF